LVSGFSENREARTSQVHEGEGFHPETENKLFELAFEVLFNQVLLFSYPLSISGMNFLYTIYIYILAGLIAINVSLQLTLAFA
jgi:hypothetical protein